MQKISLSVKNLKKEFYPNHKKALNGISFEINSNEIVGFIGSNGAGKSTCIYSMVGALDFDGEILINGYNIKTDDVKAKSFIGYVADNIENFSYLSGKDFIEFVALSHKIPKKEYEQRLSYLLTRFNLNFAIDDKMSTYSKGMKQKVLIIAALINSPKILILDEPLSGIDLFAAKELKEIMKEIASDGGLVLFSSHILEVVEKLCTRVIFIKNGEIIDDMSIEKLNKIKNEKNITLEEFFVDIMKN